MILISAFSIKYRKARLPWTNPYIPSKSVRGNQTPCYVVNIYAAGG